MQILTGHVSPETAYVVNDYPYGFRLRCQKRYWLEYKRKLGFRLVSQTSNPKVAGLVWNKPKAGNYVKFGACMFLDAEGHVAWATLGEYSTGAEAKAWADKYGAGVPEVGQDLLRRWVASKLAYDNARQPGDPLGVGLVEARRAFVEAK
jgi:hypothetical protein